MDMHIAGDNIFNFFPQADGYAPGPAAVSSAAYRVAIDPRGRELTIERTQLSPVSGEFPHADDRCAMHPYRHAFLAVSDPAKPYDAQRGRPLYNSFFNSIGHLDVHTGKVETWWAGPTGAV